LARIAEESALKPAFGAPVQPDPGRQTWIDIAVIAISLAAMIVAIVE
jgi:hypothetical protein